MRLSAEQTSAIRRDVRDTAGPHARVRLLGSPLKGEVRGGEVDLLVELPTEVESPALLPARPSARISRALIGRRVDAVLPAPNLARRRIHDNALRTGVLL